jgi:hypothetical protein
MIELMQAHTEAGTHILLYYLYILYNTIIHASLKEEWLDLDPKPVLLDPKL